MENGVMYLSNYKFDSVIKRHYKCRLTKGKRCNVFVKLQMPLVNNRQFVIAENQ